MSIWALWTLSKVVKCDRDSPAFLHSCVKLEKLLWLKSRNVPPRFDKMKALFTVVVGYLVFFLRKKNNVRLCYAQMPIPAPVSFALLSFINPRNTMPNRLCSHCTLHTRFHELQDRNISIFPLYFSNYVLSIQDSSLHIPFTRPGLLRVCRSLWLRCVMEVVPLQAQYVCCTDSC